MDGIKNTMIGLGSSSVVQLDAAARSQRKQALAPAATAPSGKAELSPLAIAAHDAGTAPVDQARIEKLRAGIADGSYQIDHAKIAAKMISLDLGWAGQE